MGGNRKRTFYQGGAMGTIRTDKSAKAKQEDKRKDDAKDPHRVDRQG